MVSWCCVSCDSWLPFYSTCECSFEFTNFELGIMRRNIISFVNLWLGRMDSLWILWFWFAILSCDCACWCSLYVGSVLSLYHESVIWSLSEWYEVRGLYVASKNISIHILFIFWFCLYVALNLLNEIYIWIDSGCHLYYSPLKWYVFTVHQPPFLSKLLFQDS